MRPAGCFLFSLLSMFMVLYVSAASRFGCVATFNQVENRPSTKRAQMKCFKCGKLGDIANKCQNFLLPSQRDRPPKNLGSPGKG